METSLGKETLILEEYTSFSVPFANPPQSMQISLGGNIKISQ
jgi:hypothetical protein